MNFRPLRTLPHRIRHGKQPEDRGLAATYRTLLEAASNAQKARIPQMAAALTYRTIFGLLPVVIVGLVSITHWADPADIEALIRKMLDSSGISAIMIDERDSTVMPPSEIYGPPAPPGLVTSAQAPTDTPDPTAETPAAEYTAEATQRLDDWIQDILKRVQGISFATLGLIGLGALIYAAMGMLVEIERAFNQIYRVPTGRSWSRRVLLYWTLLTLGPLGLVATFYVGNQFRTWADAVLTDHLSGVSTGLSAMSVVALGYLSTVTISATVLTLLYMAVPNARVRFWSALAGAVLAALAWEAGKWGLGQYIYFTRGRSYVNLYGSIALFPLFLLWVYFTWIIILMGLQFAFHTQYRNRPDPASILTDTRSTLTDPASVLSVMAHIGRAFREGRSRSARQLAPAAQLPEPVVAVMLRQLQDAGFLHRVAGAKQTEPDKADDKPEPRRPTLTPDQADALSGDELLELASFRYTLARPPEAIRLADLLACAHAMTPGGRTAAYEHVAVKSRDADEQLNGTVHDLLADVRTAERSALADRTLDALLGPEPAPRNTTKSPAASSGEVAAPSTNGPTPRTTQPS